MTVAPLRGGGTEPGLQAGSSPQPPSRGAEACLSAPRSAQGPQEMPGARAESRPLPVSGRRSPAKGASRCRASPARSCGPAAPGPPSPIHRAGSAARRSDGAARGSPLLRRLPFVSPASTLTRNPLVHGRSRARGEDETVRSGGMRREGISDHLGERHRPHRREMTHPEAQPSQDVGAPAGGQRWQPRRAPNRARRRGRR